MSKLIVGENVRLPSRMDLDGLTTDIAERGLIDPIKVWNHKNDLYEVITGHRRHAAICRLPKEAVKRLFPDGVPCIVIEEVTADEVLDLKIDDGNKLIANNPFEIQQAANFLFRSGATEEEVANRLYGLIESNTPMKTKVKQVIEGYEAVKVLASNDGDKAKVAEYEKLIRKERADYYRGRVQNLNAAYRSPEKVMETLYLQNEGSVGPTYDGKIHGELPSRLTTGQVNILFKAHCKDLDEHKEGGIPTFNKSRTGPAFNAKWDSILEDDKKEEKDKPVRQKSMSGKDMTKEIEDGVYKSQGFNLLTQHHLGQEVTGLADSDATLYRAELVQVNEPELWADIVAKANAIEAEQIQNDKDAEADQS